MNSSSSNLTILPLGVIFFAALISLLLSKKYAKAITITAILAAILAVLALLLQLNINHQLHYHFGGWRAPLGIEYVVNNFNIIIVLMVLFNALAAVIISKHLNSELSYILLLYIAGLCGMSLSNDLFNIYVLMEISAIASYILVLKDNNNSSTKSALNYLITGTVATSFILLGIGLFYMQTGSLNLTDLATRLASLSTSVPFFAGYLLIIIGLLIKAGIPPFSSWVLDVYHQAEISIVSIFAGSANKVYIYLILKLIMTISLADNYLNYLESLAIFAMVFASFLALNSRGLSLIIFSSLVQLSYLVLLISNVKNNPQALIAVIFGMLNHALSISSLLLIYSTNLTNNITRSCLLFNLLSLVGLPINLGFLFKWYFLSAIIANKHYVSFAVVIITSAISLRYYFNIWSDFSKKNDMIPAARFNLYQKNKEIMSGLTNSKELSKKAKFDKLAINMRNAIIWCFAIINLLLCLFANQLIAWII